MKKRNMVLVFLLVLTFSLTGCGSGTASSDDNTVTPAKSTPKNSNTASDTPVEEESPDAAIEEQLLIDQEGVKITAVSLEEDGFFGPEVKLKIENTTDKNITVQTLDTSINGLMIEPTLSCNVAAGMQANDVMAFYTVDLENNGIEKIASIEFKFNIFETDSYDTILVTDAIILDTAAKDGYVQAYDDTGEVILDSNDIKIVAKGLVTDDLMGPEIKLYIENNSKTGITVETQNFSINGIMVSPITYSAVLPGKKANTEISFYDLEENGIEDISNAEFSFHIADSATYDTILDSDVIALTFSAE